MLVARSGQNKVCMCVIFASKGGSGEGGKGVIFSEWKKNKPLFEE